MLLVSEPLPPGCFPLHVGPKHTHVSNVNAHPVLLQRGWNGSGLLVLALHPASFDTMSTVWFMSSINLLGLKSTSVGISNSSRSSLDGRKLRLLFPSIHG